MVRYAKGRRGIERAPHFLERCVEMSTPEREAGSHRRGDEQCRDRIAEIVAVDRLSGSQPVVDEQVGSREVHSDSIADRAQIEAGSNRVDGAVPALDTALRRTGRSELDDAQRIRVPKVSL